MTEMSMLWTTNGIGHGASEYPQDDAGEFFRRFTNSDPASMGVVYETDTDSLLVTGSSSPLAIGTGIADVYGFRAWNDASKNLAVTTPGVGDTGGRVVLVANWAAQTVTAEVVLNVDGNPSIPALVQTVNTTWHLPIASFVIDTSGDIWTDSGKTVAGVTDTRNYLVSPLASRSLIRRQGGSATDWTTAGTTNYPNQASVMQVGAASTHGITGVGTVTFPQPFAYPPLVWFSSPGAPIAITTITATTAEFTASVAGSTVYWQAIGAVA